MKIVLNTTRNREQLRKKAAIQNDIISQPDAKSYYKDEEIALTQYTLMRELIVNSRKISIPNLMKKLYFKNVKNFINLSKPFERLFLILLSMISKNMVMRNARTRSKSTGTLSAELTKNALSSNRSLTCIN